MPPSVPAMHPCRSDAAGYYEKVSRCVGNLKRDVYGSFPVACNLDVLRLLIGSTPDRMEAIVRFA